LADDSFVNWNLSQDESDANFKEKLGVLQQIKERAEKKKLERQADEKSRLEAEKEARETKEKEKSHNSNKVTRGKMTLDTNGSKFSWRYTGKAVHGYKLVYSKDPGPTFGSDEALYFSNINETSGSISKKENMKGGKYHVRVCAYTADTEDEKCVDYSNE